MTSPIDLAHGASLGALSIYSGTILAESDWQKVIGPYGALFLACVILTLTWTNNRRKERREESRRDREEEKRDKRHEESMKIQKENWEMITGLTAENIQARLISSGAIDRMSSSIQGLTLELKERPCQIKPIQSKQ